MRQNDAGHGVYLTRITQGEFQSDYRVVAGFLNGQADEDFAEAIKGGHHGSAGGSLEYGVSNHMLLRMRGPAQREPFFGGAQRDLVSFNLQTPLEANIAQSGAELLLVNAAHGTEGGRFLQIRDSENDRISF